MDLLQKLLLTGVFLLVGFTIAVTIVRGSIFGGVYKALKDVDHKVINTAWVLFWFFIQYIVCELSILDTYRSPFPISVQPRKI